MVAGGQVCHEPAFNDKTFNSLMRDQCAEAGQFARRASQPVVRSTSELGHLPSAPSVDSLASWSTIRRWNQGYYTHQDAMDEPPDEPSTMAVSLRPATTRMSCVAAGSLFWVTSEPEALVAVEVLVALLGKADEADEEPRGLTEDVRLGDVGLSVELLNRDAEVEWGPASEDAGSAAWEGFPSRYLLRIIRPWDVTDDVWS